jgi:hypothetical protein
MSEHTPHNVMEAAPELRHHKNPPTVFAVQESFGINMLPATVYGRVLIMLPANFRTMYAAQPAARKIRGIMRNVSKDDYLLPVGDPVAIALAGAVMAERTGGWLHLLKWDNHEKCYYPVRIDVFDRYPGELRQTA